MFETMHFERTINTYCWITGTYTVAERLTGVKEVDFSHPGVGPHHKETEDLIRHSYYQWVPFFLLFQAVMLYLPNHIWRLIEQHFLRDVTKRVRGAANASDKEQVIDEMATYFHARKGSFITLFLGFAGLEVSYLIVTICNILITDTFLGGEFSRYGKYNHIQYTELN
jgi:hypothetical protein